MTTEGVKILVEQCARSTNDDATLILMQCAESIDWDSLLSRLTDYARLDSEQRERLIDRLQDAPLAAAGATAGDGLLQAYAAECADGRAAGLARLVLAAGRPDRRAVEQIRVAPAPRVRAPVRRLRASGRLGATGADGRPDRRRGPGPDDRPHRGRVSGSR